MHSDRNHRLFAILLVIVAFIYTLIRASNIFYIHDELVSKWAYMINWNYLPYQGYIDANNHLLNSLLGGAFIRLFQSDHILIVRLSSLLALLLFGLTAVSLKRHFQSPLAHLSFLVALLFSPYIIEFFSLARGYGLSWAFLLLAISLQMNYFKEGKISYLLTGSFSLLLAAYANLALITISTFGIGLLLIKALKKPIQILLLMPFLGGLAYLTKYAFTLQLSGKLYLGEMDSFFDTTLLPLLEFNFSSTNIILLGIVLFISVFLFLWLPFKLMQVRKVMPDHKLIPHTYLLFAVVSIFILHTVFDIRYPMHRAAAHLIILFTLALFFTLDQMRLYKGAAIFSVLFLLNFGIQANLTHTKEWSYEHFDRALLEKIPKSSNGIPPTTGGRFWQIDNEMARTFDYPMRALQDMSTMKDSLQDYIIVLPELNPDVNNTHQLIHQDPISNLTLYKRNEILEKALDSTFAIKLEMKAEREYYNLYEAILSGPLIIQTKGRFDNVSIFRDFQLIFSASELENDNKIQYGGIGPISSTKINQDGSVDFDFSYLIEGRKEPYLLKYYMWKKDQENLSADLKVKVFKIQ